MTNEVSARLPRGNCDRSEPMSSDLVKIIIFIFIKIFLCIVSTL